MKVVEIKKGIIRVEFYKNNPVCVYEDYFVINETKYSNDNNDYVSEENGVLNKYKDENSLCVFINGNFEPVKVKYSFPTFFDENVWIEYSYSEDKNADVRFMEHGEETLFAIKTPNGIHSPRYIKDKSILLFNDPAQKYLLAYSKTGEFIWQYTEEEDELKINWRCIPVVDDVVVVISMRGLRPEKIQGFNIHTGERLWGITFEGKGVSNTLFVGEDKILYGCMRPFASNGLVLTSLNPFTGELIKHVISEEDGFEVMPWLVTMHGRQLYYTDNRRGNEIGVIDVDKRELIERVPLNIKKKVTIGAPVVTDDKVYVFIGDLQELRVFDK